MSIHGHRAALLAAALVFRLVPAAAPPEHAWAGGSSEAPDYQSVQGLSTWRARKDLSELAPGTYNVTVRATDAAGNEGFTEPANIVVDPDSDLPQVRISHPRPGARAGANLNVVGACVDDDGVAKVLIKVDDGAYRAAEGTGFWSFLVDTSSMPDGPHTITARGVDIAGAQGTEQSVLFQLDRHKPEVRINSHESGVLLSRDAVLRGEAADGNGIRSVAFSADGGKTYRSLRFRRDKATGGARFSLPVRLRSLQGGPHVWWLQATDRQGSTGRTAFLFFVDKTPPELTIISPQPGQAVTGSFTVIGSLRDDVGVRSLRYAVRGGKEGEIPLTPGDPYWSHRVRVDPRAGTVSVTYTVTDRAGNTTSRTVKVRVDRKADRPVVTIVSSRGGLLSGAVSDDDGPAQLHLQIDGAAERTTDGNGAFTVAGAPGADGTRGEAAAGSTGFLKPGRHTVKLWATDRFGLQGPVVQARVAVAFPPPVLKFRNVLVDKEARPLLPGMSLPAERTVVVQGILLSQEPGLSLRAVVEPVSTPGSQASGPDSAEKTISYRRVSVKPGDKSGEEPGVRIFTLSLPRTRIPGAYHILIQAVRKGSDGSPVVVAQRETVITRETPPESPAAGTTAPAAGASTSAPSAPTPAAGGQPGQPEIRLLRAGLEPPGRDGSAPDPGSPEAAPSVVVLREGVSLQGYCSTSGRISSVALDPPAAFLRVEKTANSFAISATAPGSARVSVALTVDGATVRSDPVTILADHASPVVDLRSPDNGAWVRGEVEIIGAVTDDVGPVRMEYAVGEPASYRPLSPPQAKAGAGESGSFSLQVPLTDLPDGPVVVFVRATDQAGNTTELQRTVWKDATPPTLTVLSPLRDDTVQGIITVTGLAADDAQLQTVEISTGGGGFHTAGSPFSPEAAPEQSAELGREMVFAEQVDLSAGSRIVLRATDRAGNVATTEVALSVDPEADRPRVEVHFPTDGAVIRQDFTLSGVALDDDQVAAIFWRLDGGREERIQGSTSFSVPLRIADLTDGPHTVTVRAEDPGGVSSESVTAGFVVSKSDPVSVLLSPGVETVVRGTVELRGTAADPNGIRRVELSVDNGASFSTARGTEQWRYTLDTRILGDGLQSIMVLATDTTGAQGLLTTIIHVDNTPPVVHISAPADGQRLTGSLTVAGRAWDGIELVSLEGRIAALPPEQAPDEGAATGSGGAETSAAGGPAAGSSASAGTSAPAGAAQESTQGPALTSPRVIHLEPDEAGAFSTEVPAEKLPPGWYDLELRARDTAGNQTVVSRNFLVSPPATTGGARILFPLPGELRHGALEIAGLVGAPAAAEKVAIYVDGKIYKTAEVRANGYFSLHLEGAELADGEHSLGVRTDLSADPGAESPPAARTVFSYEAAGPWVTVENSATGDYATGRPVLSGTAGYETADPSGDGEQRNKRPQAPVAHTVEISIDEGRTFQRAVVGRSGGATEPRPWRYRLEAEQLPEGPIPLLVRATFSDGRTAVCRRILYVDNTPPEITRLAPAEGAHINEVLALSGQAQDASGLQEVSYLLRKGDKQRYEVPQFVQGLYLDLHGLGATYGEAGIGLTFFDDNVKLQAQVGLAPPGRFSGLVLGAKLLANVATLPFGYLFGPDLDFFSMSATVGAAFSYFTMSEGAIAFTDHGVVLAAVVGQIEFARFDIPGWTRFSSYGLYAEGQLWFISSDVLAGVVPRFAVGARIGLF